MIFGRIADEILNRASAKSVSEGANRMWFLRQKQPPRAALYANADLLYFVTVSGIDISIEDAESHNVLLPPDAPAEIIGDSLKACLKASRRPKRWQDPDLYDYTQTDRRYKAWRSDMMTRFKYKTQTAMFSNMTLIHFETKDYIIHGEKLRIDNPRTQSWKSSDAKVLHMHSALPSDDLGAKILDYLGTDALS